MHGTGTATPRQKVTLLLLAAICATVTAASAQDRLDHLVRVETTMDLDGDHHDDFISVVFYQTGHGYGFDRFVLEVNGSQFVGSGAALDCAFQVVDIDSTDGRKEIVLSESGPSDDDATHFFGYARGSIGLIGSLEGRLPGPPGVDGSGTIHTRCRGRILQTWWYPCDYRFDIQRQSLDQVPERYRIMGTPVVLKTDLALTAEPWGDRPVGVVRAGEKATLLRTDDEIWCEIESAGGLRGWFFTVGGWHVGAGNIVATEVFDGLMIAD